MYSVQKVLNDLSGKDIQSGPLVTVLSKKMYGDGLVVELGTGKGETTRIISSSVNAGTVVHTFDSFQGRPENWRPGYQAGQDSLNGQAPRVDPNVSVHVGLFAQTLPAFAASQAGQRLALLYVDCDLYSSTKTALIALKDAIRGGTTIVFDEFLNHPQFENHEIKAFVEFLNETGKQYEVLGMRGQVYQPGQPGWDNWQFEKAAFYVFNAGEPHVLPTLSSAASSSAAASSSSSVGRPVSMILSSPSASAGQIKVSPSLSSLSSVAASSSRKLIRLVVTYGRTPYFRCLLQYILRDLDQFDEVVIWKNTKVEADSNFLDATLNDLKARGLDAKFRVVYPAKITGRADGVYPMYQQLNDPNSLYIKIDDDIVYAAPGAFANLINYSLANEHKYCVFSANVVNSGPCDALHQSQGASRDGPVKFRIDNSYDTLLKPKGAMQVHDSLQAAIAAGDTSKYDMEHIYMNNERWSINCIAFFGNLFNSKDHAQLLHDDERYITKVLGTVKNKHMVVVPGSLMAHYAFGPQRSYRSRKLGNIARLKGKQGFDADGSILAKYAELAGLSS